MNTEALIKHLRKLMPLGPHKPTLATAAAARLEELQRLNDSMQVDRDLWIKVTREKLEVVQRERDEARAEAIGYKKAIYAMEKEGIDRRAEVERLKSQRESCLSEIQWLKNQIGERAETIRPEPSRLEIAAKLMGAHVYHLGMMYQEELTLRQACLIEADALIAAAREAK